MSARCGIVLAHGDLGAGLLSALSRVAGPQSNLWALSNEGLGYEAIAAKVKRLVDECAQGRETILFSDLGGGSCGQACQRLLSDEIVDAVFYGVNLPLLVEFVFLQEEPWDEFTAKMLEKSRQAIGVSQ